jgi:hypothetical protein
MNLAVLLCFFATFLAAPEQVKTPKASAKPDSTKVTQARAKKCPQIAADGSTVFVNCDQRSPVAVRKQPATTGQGSTPESSGSTPDSVLADSPLGKKLIEAQTASLDYQIEALNHRRKVFRWQHTSSIVIFCLVTVLVIAGLALAALQFWEASRAQKAHTEIATENARNMSSVAVENARTLTAARAEAIKLASSSGAVTPAGGVISAELPQTDNKNSATSFELSLSGIKISSSVIGLIVLAMSMGFFYLYLKFVYPIQDISTAKTATAQTQTQKSEK